jgi:Mycothiol maleylpyruvate isomerase N-terminal domain
VVVAHLLAPERAALLGLLEDLDQARWEAPTVCVGWSVKDVVAHLLGDDLGLLSRRRDRFSPPGAPAGQPRWQELVAWLDRENQAWVEAAPAASAHGCCASCWRSPARRPGATWRDWTRWPWRRGSPGPGRARTPTGWTWRGSTPSAGPTSSRSATRSASPASRSRGSWARCWRPSCTPCQRRSPVRRQRRAPPSRSPSRGRPGDAGRCCGAPGGWRLAAGAARDPVARVVLDAGTAWRRWTKGIGRDAALAAAELSGDRALGLRVLDAVAIIG